MPPSVVASAVLQLAQDQGRIAQIDPQQRGPPGPEIPGELGKAPSVAKAIPAPCDNAAPAPSVPLEASSLPNDPSVATLMEKVTELKQRMSARRSVAGLLADDAAKRAGSGLRKRVGDSRRRKRRRDSDVSSDTSSWF